MVPPGIGFIRRPGFSEAVAKGSFRFTIRFIMVAPAHKSRRVHWNWLLLLPVMGLMFPGIYARTTPVVFGFPFFYWYQMGWIALTSVITGIVYFATRTRA